MTNSTLLHRQVHPSWIQAGRVTSQAFKPMPKDDGLLSVYDGDLSTAEDAWKHYTQELKYSSDGAVSVSVEECGIVGTPAAPDPEPFDAHAVISFRSCDGKKEVERCAKLLRSYAEPRGWSYQVGRTGR